MKGKKLHLRFRGQYSVVLGGIIGVKVEANIVDKVFTCLRGDVNIAYIGRGEMIL